MSEQRSRHWVVNGICQVCMGDFYQHGIMYDEIAWCNAAKVLELGLDVIERNQ